MTQRTDQQQAYKLVEQLEANLKELKQVLGHPPRTTLRISKKHRVFKSLYGAFPRTRTTWTDFRDARQSWSRRLENF